MQAGALDDNLKPAFEDLLGSEIGLKLQEIRSGHAKTMELQQEWPKALQAVDGAVKRILYRYISLSLQAADLYLFKVGALSDSFERC